MHKYLLSAALLLTLSACATTEPATTGPFVPAAINDLELNTESSQRLRASDPVNPRDGAPYRIYRIALERDQILRVDVESGAFAPAIALFGPDGTLLGSTEVQPAQTPDPNDPYGYYGGYNAGLYGAYGESYDIYGNPIPNLADDRRKTLIRRSTDEGEHYVVISAMAAGELGAFALEAEIEAANPPLPFPGDVRGLLFEGLRLHPQTGLSYQAYPIDIGQTTALQLHVQSRDFQPTLAIVAAGSEMPLINQHGTDNEVHLLTELAPGAYEIRVIGRDGRFSLSAQRAAIQRSDAFEIGTTYDGFLSIQTLEALSGQMQMKGQPFPIEITEPTILDATLRSSDFNAYLLLTDEQGIIVAQDTDSGFDYTQHVHSTGPPRYDARVYRTLQPGRYTLWASAVDQNSGAFRLHTTLHEATQNRTLELGQTLDAVLTQEAPLHELRYIRSAPLSLTITDPTRVRIDLVTADFDGYLTLEDSNGREIAPGNAMMHPPTKSLTEELAPGTYTVHVFGIQHNAVGAFQVHTETLE